MSVFQTVTRSSRRAGFTLIEMAIVILIIGLLAGGVLVGQTLIRSAELQTIATDMQKYQSAAKQFQDLYYALPGDFAGAVAVWGSAGAPCVSTVSNGKESCDGNGNGQLESAPAATDSNEWFRFWQQLEAAELIDKHYTGVAGSGGATHAVPGENVPDSAMGTSGWSVRWIGFGAPSATYFEGTNPVKYGHVLEFGGATADNITNAATLNPQEAFSIDDKVDDGRPGRGKVMAHPFDNGCTDAADNNALDAAYGITDGDPLCSLVFRDVF